jgi:type I restriction enzyme S subunit
MLVETGVDWLGKLPSHWEVSKIGHCFNHRNETVSDKDFEPLSVTKNGVLPQLETAAKSDNSDGRKLIRKGDFVINQRSDRKGSAGVSPLDGSCSVIYTVLEPVRYHPTYAHHLFRSIVFQEEFYRWGTGIVDDLWSTRYSLMKQISCPVPPVEEQKAIADFLDSEIEKIDYLLQKQDDLVRNLASRRKALIQSVIAGKISVPGSEPRDNWVVNRFGRIVKNVELKNSSNVMISLEHIESQTGRILPLPELESAVEGTQFRVGDVIFGKLRPYLAKVAVVEHEGVAGGDIHVYRSKVLLPAFLKYWLLSSDTLELINSATYGIKMPRANWEQIKMLEVQFPSLDTQARLAIFLDRNLANIQRLSQAAMELSGHLRERRETLIVAAVTGKIDVKGK